jgi:hypothetical protein
MAPSVYERWRYGHDPEQPRHEQSHAAIVEHVDNGGVRRASRWQDAARILLLINAAADPVSTASNHDDDVPQHAVGVVQTQVRLQKLDFWVRNPDYLADELLNEYENHPDDPGLWRKAEEILDSPEPELRRFPMLRHRFGAYERLDDTVSVLVEKGMVAKRSRLGQERVLRHDYYLLNQGRQNATSILEEAPALTWYVERTRLVVALSEGLGASEIKARQYLQRDYAETQIGDYIGSIADRARARLANVRQQLEIGSIQ